LTRERMDIGIHLRRSRSFAPNPVPKLRGLLPKSGYGADLLISEIFFMSGKIIKY